MIRAYSNDGYCSSWYYAMKDIGIRPRASPVCGFRFAFGVESTNSAQTQSSIASFASKLPLAMATSFMFWAIPLICEGNIGPKSVIDSIPAYLFILAFHVPDPTLTMTPRCSQKYGEGVIL